MAEPYSFGRFTLDRGGRKLLSEGVPVDLGSTGFRLLVALIENAGKVISKDDLISRVWGRAAVNDNNLHVQIAALRKIVGGDFIVTEQGRGYRFTMPVQDSAASAPAQKGRSRSDNLPLYDSLSPLIGRENQLHTAIELLQRTRLLTLTGPGGVGKTRFALQVATETSSMFGDGVWLVELGTLTEPELIVGAIASTLDIKVGVNAGPLAAVARYLDHKSVLIVLDNCEHVLAAVARASEALLTTAPRIKILATSREPLTCSGEKVFEVPALAVPGEGVAAPDQLRSAAAVKLFLERVMDSDSNFSVAARDLQTIAAICRRVDGLPLAIEMVAAWASPLGLDTLDTKLDGLLKTRLRARSIVPQRHSTLYATVDWSHELLSDTEKALLRRLSVFPGNFSLTAAEAVTAGGAVPKEQVFEKLAALIRKSMIAVVPSSGARRFRLLETTRAFMLERLSDSGEEDLVRQQHAAYVLGVLERAMHEWESTSDSVWLDRYGSLLEDLRSALDWAMTQNSDQAVALAGASWPLWREMSIRVEGRQRLFAAIGQLRANTPAALEARLRRGLGELLLNTAEARAARDEIERSVDLYRELNDSLNLGSALAVLSDLLLVLGRPEEAQHAIEEALNLLEPSDWFRTLAAAYSLQLCIEGTIGRLDAARIAGQRAQHFSEMAGCDRTNLVVTANLVQLSIEAGDVDAAVSAGRNLALRLRDSRHSELLAFTLGVLAAALIARGDLNEALAVAREAAPLLQEEGNLFWLFDHLALRSALAGRHKEAALLSGFSNSLHERCGFMREVMGRLAMERTTGILQGAFAKEELGQFITLGSRLTEDQALAIALSN